MFGVMDHREIRLRHTPHKPSLMASLTSPTQYQASVHSPQRRSHPGWLTISWTLPIGGPTVKSFVVNHVALTSKGTAWGSITVSAKIKYSRLGWQWQIFSLGRNCGEGYCSNCSRSRMAVPKRGWGTELVRVCNLCRDELVKNENGNSDHQGW